MANDQKNEWSARLKAFGMIIKLSNDLFAAPDFTTASGIAVNSSRTLLRYKSSTMLEIQGGKAVWSRRSLRWRSTRAPMRRRRSARSANIWS